MSLNKYYSNEYGKLLHEEDEIALKLASQCQQKKQEIENQEEQEEQDDLDRFLDAYEMALKETSEWTKLDDPYVPF